MTTLTTGKATEFIQFTRASNATVTDSDGKVKWAPHNLLTNSESFDGSSWGLSGLLAFGSGSSANATAAPNSTTTADYLRETNTSARHFLFAIASTTAGANYTARVFVKAGERTFVALGIRTTDGVTGYAAAFNLSTGAMTATSTTGSPTNVSAPAPVAIGSGWYLLSVSMDATTSQAYVEVGLSDSATPTFAAGMPTYTGTGTSGLYLWGAHVYRSDLGGMQANTSAYPMYNPTTPKNLLGYTEAFNSWTRSAVLAFGSGSVSDTVLAPNGLQTADKIVADTTNAAHVIYQTFTSSATTYTLSFYAKAAGYSLVRVADFGGGGRFYASFDLSNGSVVAGSTGGSLYVSSAITSVGDGWYRCSIVATFGGAASSSPGIIGYPAGATLGTTGATYTGDGTSGIYLWGAQLSDSASLDPYVPVYGAAVTSAAYYGPRRDFDPVTLACKGLLVEEQRTNAFTYSSEFDNGAWIKGAGYNSTISANTSTAPDGTTTADSVVADNAGGTGNVILARTFAVTSGTSYTMTFFAKAGTLSWIRLYALGYTSPGNGGAYFSLNGSGSIGTVDSGYTASISAFANGWYRCSLSFTAGSSVTGELRFMLANANNDTAVARNGTSSVIAWGAQLEAGSFATSYIPTGAATATRNGDLATVSTQAFPFNAAEGTLIAQSTIRTWSTLAYPTHASLNDTTGSNALLIYTTNAGQTITDLYTGGVQQYSATFGTIVDGQTTKMANAYKTNDMQGARDGTVSAVDTSATIPIFTRLEIGGYASSSRINGHIRQITYLPRRISSTELQTRTQ